MKKQTKKRRRGSVEVIVVVVAVLVVILGGWFYVTHNTPAAVTPAGVSPISSTTAPTSTPTPASPQPAAVKTGDATSQYTLFHPAGAAASILGGTGNQFKIQYVAFTTIKTPGGSTWQYPFFNQYFYNGQTNTGWSYTATAADGSGYLKAVVLSMDIYTAFPTITMDYPVIDPDTGTTRYVSAPTILPENNGEVTFSPVGSIHPTGRIVFAVPTEATGTIVYYPGGALAIDLNAQTITPITAASNLAPVQSGPVSVTSVPLSWYASSLKTYTDSSGAFSVQYPGSFTPDASINGNPAGYLDSELVVITPSGNPEFSLSSQINGSIEGIDIQYSSPGNATACQDPGNEVQNGVEPATTINGTNWYRATVLNNNGVPRGGRQYVTDVYQTLQGGKCFGVAFAWSASAGQDPGYNAVAIFEESVLGTFRVSNAAALSDTIGSSGAGY